MPIGCRKGEFLKCCSLSGLVFPGTHSSAKSMFWCQSHGCRNLHSVPYCWDVLWEWTNWEMCFLVEGGPMGDSRPVIYDPWGFRQNMGGLDCMQHGRVSELQETNGHSALQKTNTGLKFNSEPNIGWPLQLLALYYAVGIALGIRTRVASTIGLNDPAWLVTKLVLANIPGSKKKVTGQSMAHHPWQDVKSSERRRHVYY